jgi:effector-binding domain-containing protein
MTDFELTEYRQQDTAVVHDTVPISAIPSLFDRAIPAVASALAAQGAHPTGPPFAKYLGPPGDTVDVEVGFPVSRPVSPADDVIPSTLPSTLAAHGVHVGPYELLSHTYDEMLAWMKQQGVQPAEVMWEVYLSDPSAEPDPAAWRTDVWWAVSRAQRAGDAAG